MPVWNGGRYLGESVRSILNQTETRFEFLIIDDGSTDETPEILAGFARCDPRIRVIRLEHGGLVAALNHGLAECPTEWVARMDCDDVAHPRRLALQLRAIEKHADAVLCHTQVRYVGDSRYVTRSARMIQTRALTILSLCHRCHISHPTVIYRKSKVVEAGGYLEEDPHVEDYSLWGRLIGLGDFIAVPEPLLELRLHDESISKKESAIQMGLSGGIALRHCRQFLRLDNKEAERALRTLRCHGSDSSLRDWCWLLTHCLPRLGSQSLELWLWAIRKTMPRIIHALRR